MIKEEVKKALLDITVWKRADTAKDSYSCISAQGFDVSIRKTVSGSTGGNVALQNLLVVLASLKLINNNTS